MWVKLKCSYQQKGGEAVAGTVIEVSAGEGKRLVNELGVAELANKPAPPEPSGKVVEKTVSTGSPGADGDAGATAGADTGDDNDPAGGQQ